MIYISGQVRCKLQGVSYIVSKRYELWSTNGFKLEVSFHPPSINSAFHFIARLCRQRSANGTQPNFAKWWTVIRANSLPWRSWGRPWGQTNIYSCSVFRWLGDLIYWTTHDIDNQARALENTKGLLRCPRISWTLVHKQLETEPELLPTLIILFCSSPSHTLYVALTWCLTGTLNETALGSSAAQIWSPKRC